jgi:glycosyltransferase involved in cell wall biosynthesis
MKVSIIIPSYNSARWLASAVESVRHQTRPADEIVIVDDGSTDGTAALCQTFGKGVKYVHRGNGGLAAARNTGTRESSGDWLLFLDADDILLPNALHDLLRTAEESDAGVVYGFVLQRRAAATDAQLHGRPYAVGNPHHPAKAHFWWTPIPTAGCALIRRSLNEEVGGFDENFRQVEDAEYWLRCGVAAPFAHCDSVVLDKTYIPTSLGQQTEGSIWYRLQLQRKFLLWCSQRRIDTAFLEATPSDIVDHALKRISREHAWGVLPVVLEQAREMRVRSLWYWRSLLTALILKVTGRQALPARACPVIYSAWLHEGPSMS